MRHEFFHVVSTAELRELLAGLPLPAPATEELSLAQAHGRVLAAELPAREDLPPCTRSSMDGYAVRAADCFGAGEANPAYLELAGEVRIDEPPAFSLEPGFCAAITTGGCLPAGADAVVMVEHTQDLGAGTIEIRKSLAPNDNVMLKGEDAAKGATLVPPGTRIRPQEAGLLAALGYERVPVLRRPRVGLVSTGDELVPVGATPRPGQIRDVNTTTLAGIVAQAGAEPVAYGIVADDLDSLTAAVRRGLSECDTLLLSGGSSVGVRDFTVAAIEALGGTVLVHGVSVSPGKPTILASVDGKPVWGLPGQVTSAQVVMHVFGLPFLRRLGGETDAFDTRSLPVRRAVMARNVASKQGREDYVRVRLEPREGALPLAHPRLGKSGLLRTLIECDGLVPIPARSEGLNQGDEVDVRLL